MIYPYRSPLIIGRKASKDRADKIICTVFYYLILFPVSALSSEMLALYIFCRYPLTALECLHQWFFCRKSCFSRIFSRCLPYFSTSTSDLPIFVPGRSNLSTFFISPPRILTAFTAFLISSSESALLYEIKCPVIPTKGRQYSHNVDKLATARETQRSNRSLNSFFFAKSSALP